MEQFCKRSLIVTLLLTYLPIGQLHGQNYYNSRDVYYNMDTVGSIIQGKEYLDTVDMNFDGEHFSDPKYNRTLLMESISLPIIEILDTSITQAIGSHISEALNAPHLMFPDTSGIFVVVSFSQNKQEDKTKLDAYITAYSNYYLYNASRSPWDDALYEWYGYSAYTNVGCFFYDDVLCIVRLCNPMGPNSSRIQCRYRETAEKMTLNIYKKTFEIIEYGYYSPTTEMTIPVCKDD